MRILCKHCEKTLNLPDDKLPKTKVFGITCPCPERKKLTVDTERAIAYPSDKPPQAAEPAQTRQTPQAPSSPSQTQAAQPSPTPPATESAATPNEPSIEPEIFPPGAKAAFLHFKDENWNQALTQALKNARYYLSTAATDREAVLKLGLNHYDLVLIEDREEHLPVINEINSWNGIRRRDINYVLAGNGGASLNPQESFVRGANFYLNLQDVGRAAELLDEIVKGFDLYYEPWTQAKTGENKE